MTTKCFFRHGTVMTTRLMLWRMDDIVFMTAALIVSGSAHNLLTMHPRQKWVEWFWGTLRRFWTVIILVGKNIIYLIRVFCKTFLVRLRTSPATVNNLSYSKIPDELLIMDCSKKNFCFQINDVDVNIDINNENNRKSQRSLLTLRTSLRFPHKVSKASRRAIRKSEKLRNHFRTKRKQFSHRQLRNQQRQNGWQKIHQYPKTFLPTQESNSILRQSSERAFRLECCWVCFNF